MEIVTGKLSREFLHFLVGYSAVAAGIALAMSSKTTTYMGIVSALEKAPLPAAILGAPLVFVLGVLIHEIRISIQRHLFRQGPHQLSALTVPEVGALRQAAEAALPDGFSVRELDRPGELDRLWSQVDPGYTPYRVYERWVYELLADLVPTALFAVVVVVVRTLAFSLAAWDWVILAMSVAVLAVAAISIPRLRQIFTVRDGALLVSRYSAQHQKAVEQSPEDDHVF